MSPPEPQLDTAGPFTFVAVNALTVKVREGGRVINAAVMLVTGVKSDGHRGMVGLRVATSKPGHMERVLRQPGRPLA